MKKRRNKGNKINIKVIALISVVIITAILVETIILAKLNQASSNKTVSVLLDQVSSILEKNKKNEDEMIESLKQEYIVRAKAVAYVIDQGISCDINKLNEIAELMEIDEIHLFDENGTIYDGTCPEYYGLNFNDGEQIRYFLPMLKDKKLTMCQEVMPNTAENKSMMYAITWNDAGDKMIQIGIEPLRLLNELKENEIPEVISNMPAYEGVDIYVADGTSYEIIGATNEDNEGKVLEDVGITNYKDIQDTFYDIIHIHGYRAYCEMRSVGDYVVAVTFSTEPNVKNFFVAIVIEIIYMLLAGIVIYLTVKKLLAANKERDGQFAILSSLADIYYSMHIIDLENNSAYEYNCKDKVKELFDSSVAADEMMSIIMSESTDMKYVDKALAFTELKTLPERMENKKIISSEFVGKSVGWFLASFIAIESDECGKPTKVIFTTRIIDEEKKKEQKLIHKSNTDELTGFYNRRAYEDDIEKYDEEGIEDDFVYVSFDVNGLKVVNDKLGHIAGDELIVGVCECMEKCFKPYGKLYRIGGDEFVAIIFADKDNLDRIKEDFEKCTSEWRGKYVDCLTVSTGYVTKSEAQNASIHIIANLADKRMYDSKAEYYSMKGINREGQLDAHRMLCDLYTKILRINITDDTYSIINMDENEQVEDKGTSQISVWMSEIGVNGKVHPDDVEEYISKTTLAYMRNYFHRKKSSLRIFYRRKIGNEYRKVMMEVIKANDYSDDNQILYLYVKNIDK